MNITTNTTKPDLVTREYEWLGTNYRVVLYPMFERYGLLEIQEWEEANYFWQKAKWKRIYMGHVDPIEKAISYFNKANAGIGK